MRATRRYTAPHSDNGFQRKRSEKPATITIRINPDGSAGQRTRQLCNIRARAFPFSDFLDYRARRARAAPRYELKKRKQEKGKEKTSLSTCLSRSLSRAAYTVYTYFARRVVARVSRDRQATRRAHPFVGREAQLRAFMRRMFAQKRAE